MTGLRIEGLTVRYGRGRRAMTAVDGVSLTVPPGKIVSLVGESGSGKSTLARAVVGLAPVAAGHILLDDEDIASHTARHRHIQMVFQDPYASLNPRMTVGATLDEALRARAGARLTREQRGQGIGRLLDLVALSPEHAGMLPGRLSGGQRQRVALARALAVRPDVIIADEITSALDVSVQGAVLNLVRDIQARLGTSMLFISHNLEVVRYVSDVIAVMYLGRIVEAAPTEELLARPRHPYTKTLLAAVPRLGRSWREITTPSGDLDAPDPHHPPQGCPFHPRCPVGPRVNASRSVCLTLDPQLGAARRPHRAACHFADDPAAAGGLRATGPTLDAAGIAEKRDGPSNGGHASLAAVAATDEETATKEQR
ncbi:ABC transporter ATP-binding protein [Streptomyces sp. NPDC046900]|uniref:ABC transporter ATP-binding protein n=1 Tax=Streptomyces sp. NPDC046900 TaxID=3155473 RepID=UPI0033D579A6